MESSFRVGLQDQKSGCVVKGHSKPTKKVQSDDDSVNVERLVEMRHFRSRQHDAGRVSHQSANSNARQDGQSRALAVPVFAVASPAAAQVQSLPREQQITSAVLPLPQGMREGATVLGYNTEGKLVSLRSGKGDMICLADDPAQERFHVACYHRSLEPFMARGRALRAKGTRRDQIDTLRYSEIRSGKLKMPRTPASLYSLTGASDSFDAATGTLTKASPLHVVYIPFATEKSTGLSAVPSDKLAWLMFPGTPKAHIMFVPSMQ